MELFTKFLNSKQKLLRINTNTMPYNRLKPNKSNTNTGNMISSLMVENKIKKENKNKYYRKNRKKESRRREHEK